MKKKCKVNKTCERSCVTVNRVKKDFKYTSINDMLAFDSSTNFVFVVRFFYNFPHMILILVFYLERDNILKV